MNNYFFASKKEVPLYDRTIEMIGPGYRQLHQMMHDIAVASLNESAPRNGGRFIGLDIGSGTGTEAISLLRKIKNLSLIALDSSKNMLEEFRRNAEKARIPSERFAPLASDVLSVTTGQRIRDEATRAFNAEPPLDIVISAFTLHHLSSSDKTEVFKMVHDLLAPGGIFLLGDLFNFEDESDWLTENVFKWEVAWFSENLERAALKAERVGNSGEAKEMRSLKKKWVKHYENENHLGGMNNQIAQLRSAGFRQAGSPFRNWQVGLIAARK